MADSKPIGESLNWLKHSIKANALLYNNHYRNIEPEVCNMDIISSISPLYEPLNMERFERFQTNIKNGVPDSVRVFNYGIEGQLYLSNLFFNGTTIWLVIDTTKKEVLTNIFTPSIEMFSGNKIVRKKSNRHINYELMNDSNFVATILWHIRPPHPDECKKGIK